MNRDKWVQAVLLVLVVLLATVSSGPTGSVREYVAKNAQEADRAFCASVCVKGNLSADCESFCGGLKVLWDSKADGANGP